MNRISQGKRNQIFAAVVVLTSYALIVGLMTWPAPLRLSQELIGNNIDNWIFYWNNWWLGRAVTEGRDWFSTPYMFYPQGTSLTTHSNSFLNSLLALAFEPLVGPVAAYNLVLLVGLWVGAVGMFALMHEMTENRSAAFVSGLVFAFAPYHVSQALAHPHLSSVHWWPFYALFLRRALRLHRPIDALCAGLFAALTLWSGFQLAVLLMLWTALYIGYHLLRWLLPGRRAQTPLDGCTSPASDDPFLASPNDHLRGTGRRPGASLPCLRLAEIVALVGIVALILSAPIVLPVAEDYGRLAEVSTDFDEGSHGQTDLLAYLLPPTYHPIVGPRVASHYARFSVNRTTMPYLGYTALALVAVSLLSRQRKAAFWLISACLWMILAAGSAPRLNGTVYDSIPLPYGFVERIFPISAMRSPDRFNLLVVFSLAALAGLGAAHVASRRRWLLAPLSLLILVEYLCAPAPAWDLPPGSPFYERMSREAEPYGVVDYPMGYTSSKLWLYYQTLHGKPTVEGHISRYTRQDYAFITSHPLLRALYQTAERPVYLPASEFADTDVPVSALGPALRSLRDADVRYILLHKSYTSASEQAHFQRLLPAAPIYEDATLAAYDVAQPLPFTYDGFPVQLTPDVTLARFDVQQDEAGAEWRIQVLTALLAPRGTSLECQIQLMGEGGAELSSPITFFGSLMEEQDTWKAGDLELQEATVSLRELPPATYRWALACPEGATYATPETLTITDDGVTYLRRQVDVVYGDGIKLQGYRWQTVAADLQVTLRWEALERPDGDYKVFVHLLNAEGELVRQYDAVPCDWQCPTSGWRPGEIILDQAVIPLWGLPPGEYALAVGLYSPTTGRRLPARAPEGVSSPDALFLFPDAFQIAAETTLE